MSDINPEFKIINGIPMISSLEVARVFGKRHDNVLRAYRSLECSEEDRALNFEESTFDNVSGRAKIVRKHPMFWMTKDGFTFLVMGFTGRQAAKYKWAYIRLFNAMLQTIQEQQLLLAQRAMAGDDDAREAGKKQRKEFTAAVQALVEYAKAQGSEHPDRYYSLFTLMEYKELGLDFDPEVESFRDTLDANQLMLLATTELLAAKVITRAMAAGLPYKEIFQTVKIQIRETIVPVLEQLR